MARLILSAALMLLLAKPVPAQESLERIAADFWNWRSRTQPYNGDDVPRLERPAGLQRSWSAGAVAEQRAAWGALHTRWIDLDTNQWPVARQVDYWLVGSALARVRWELDLNRRWENDPTFYIEQTLSAVQDVLLAPPPFEPPRCAELILRLRNIPGILEDGKSNLLGHASAPLAQSSIASLEGVRLKLQRLTQEIVLVMPDSRETAKQVEMAVTDASAALEGFCEWLRHELPSMNQRLALGRDRYLFFLREVALIPESPEEMLVAARREWERAVAFESLERQRNARVPALKTFDSIDQEVRAYERGDQTIREFLVQRGLLSVPKHIQHFTARPVPPYLDALADFGEMDDFTGPSRLDQPAVRWIHPPAPNLPFWEDANARDPRPNISHEGTPGHYFQLAWSWTHPDPIRRYYFDSGPNEGIAFYTEEMLLQAGLYDDSPRVREMVYHMARLRAVRVEADIKLATGEFSIAQAADFLARMTPLDARTAEGEARFFAATPGQAISYQAGKQQILRFLADARLRLKDQFDLRAFHDFLWLNGNVPISLQRWEYLGLGDDVQALSARPK